MELDTADIVGASQGLEVEVMMGDPPRVILLEAEDHNAVGSQVRDICEGVVTGVFVDIYNLEIQ